MGLLDEFLKEYREEDPRTHRLSPLSAKGGLTKETDSQNIENVHKNTITDARYDSRSLEHGGWGPRKNRGPSNNLGEGPKNVAFVACVRENESPKLPPSSQEGAPSEPPPVSCHARASDKGDKPDCEACPACGLWDGYGRMGPGWYCFYSAYFKGKAAKPVPIAEAQKACQKSISPDSFQ